MAVIFLGHLQVQHMGLGREGLWGALCVLVEARLECLARRF